MKETTNIARYLVSQSVSQKKKKKKKKKKKEQRMANNNKGEVQPAQVGRIAKLPSFWREDPELWFSEMEATFSIAQIIHDETTLSYVVDNADPVILPHIADVIRAPPSQDKYKTIKTRILSAFAEAEEVKLRRVLKGLVLGDLKPSHHLQRMRNAAGTQCSDAVLRSLFMEQLPEQTRAILAGNHGPNLTNVSLLADKILELQRHNLIMAASSSTTTGCTACGPAIAALSTKLETLSVELKRFRRRTPSRGRSRSRPREQPNSWCHFYRKFGAKAWSCRPPCAWKTSTEMESEKSRLG
ncbi:uncharacterized protein LOC143181888 [Calliopsis andreniformis]|uniref:uncharacterized protein LOC143181888 n=1 Tax=Calliopsis andreniformis TaxID=337506 RepID=UPI003FCC58BE